MNEKGHLCIGRECIMAEATPEGLRFRLDPESCDPKTRDSRAAACFRLLSPSPHAREIDLDSSEDAGTMCFLDSRAMGFSVTFSVSYMHTILLP